MPRTTIALMTTFLLAASVGLAQETGSEATTPGDAAAVDEATAGQGAEGEGAEWPELTYQTGKIVLPNDAATLDLNEKYRYLDPKQTETMLVAWGNPPGAESLGAVVPASTDPFTDEGWAVILTYIDEGHVDDKDAQEIDYADMLKDMRKETRAGSEARVEAGYGTVELLGWAQPPRYDQTARKLYWAKELNFGGSDINTLNYDVRVLGREGVLSMNAVASMPQMDGVAADMQELLTMASFNPGYRYEEFNADTDRAAAYGLGALVAGGIAAKAGLFAKLGALLIAFKKFFIIAAVALGGLLLKLLRRKSTDAQPT